MVDKLQVDNPANKAMHYRQTSVGILNPPDRLPKVTVYSGVEAQKRYDEMQHDLYISEKRAKKYEKRGFPTILKIIGGGAIIAGIIKCRKNIWKGIKKLLRH
mgnify:FL=1